MFIHSFKTRSGLDFNGLAAVFHRCLKEGGKRTLSDLESIKTKLRQENVKVLEMFFFEESEAHFLQRRAVFGKCSLT